MRRCGISRKESAFRWRARRWGIRARRDWYRHVVHGKAGWFLVVDEDLGAGLEGEFLVEGRWHVLTARWR